MNQDELKALRKELYQKAKLARQQDPHYQALKERMKSERREQYQRYKNHIKAQKLAERIKKQQERDQELAETFGLAEQLRLLKFD